MKYFNCDKDVWGSKINFVDENNVLVGFDYSHQCCELFGWYIKEEIDITDRKNCIDDSNIDDSQLEGWVFDPDFFQEHAEESDWESKKIAIFRLVNGDKERYLHLYNKHNGYYSHGFQFCKDEVVLRGGHL